MLDAAAERRGAAEQIALAQRHADRCSAASSSLVSMPSAMIWAPSLTATACSARSSSCRGGSVSIPRTSDMSTLMKSGASSIMASRLP